MINVNSKITSVTVYKSKAQITRTAEITLPQGNHSLLFDNLPVEIENNSLQAQGKGDAVLCDIKLKSISFRDFPDAELQALNVEKTKLLDSITEVKNQIARLENEKNLVKKIEEKLTHSDQKVSEMDFDVEKWNSVIEFSLKKMEIFDSEIFEAQKNLRNLDSSLSFLNEKINSLGKPKSKTQNQAIIEVEMKNEGSLMLEISYLVRNASWFPVYDLRVSTETKTLTLHYNAMIQQQTGESWENIALKLSTAPIHIGGQPPELAPWYLSSQVISTRSESFRKGKLSAMTNQMFVKEESLEEDESCEEDKCLSDIVVPNAEVKSGSTSVLFIISQTQTILSHNEPQKISILIKDFPVSFRYSAVPKLSPYAYLKMKVKNESEFPLLAGETNVFLNSHFISHSKMNLVAPNEEFWAFLGIDEGIKVEYKEIKKFQKLEGFIGKKRKEFFEYLIILKNLKKTEEEIVIWDQIPISQHQDIIVELLEPKYKEETAFLKKNEHQFLEWLFKVKPNDEIRIPFRFSVEFPQEMYIYGL